MFIFYRVSPANIIPVVGFIGIAVVAIILKVCGCLDTCRGTETQTQVQRKYDLKWITQEIINK